MHLIKLVKNRTMVLSLACILISLSPDHCYAQIPSDMTTASISEDSNIALNPVTYERKRLQMKAVISEMEEQLSIYSGDTKLQQRYEKAKMYYDEADKCYQYAIEDKENNYEAPTAGVAAITSDVNSTDSWVSEFDKYVAKCLALNPKADYFHGYYNLDEDRKNVVNTALSLKGKISYEWGSKPESKGWNARWNTPGTGLDCSGFVAWTYWTGLDQKDINPNLMSTLSISRNVEKIEYSELLPGDLGMIIDDGTYYTDINGSRFYSPDGAVSSNEMIKEDLEQKSIQKQLKIAKKKANKAKKDFDENKFLKSATADINFNVNDVKTHSNHVGIYVGKDKNGNDLWCHCTGGSLRTVVVNSYDRFQYFYHVLENEEE